MTVRSKVQNIPLSQLALSPANVRKTPPSAAEDAALEASIRAHGILQNLIVHRATIGAQSVYEVDAGGRRLKILQKQALRVGSVRLMMIGGRPLLPQGAGSVGAMHCPEATPPRRYKCQI
jgi:hypothetical protein